MKRVFELRPGIAALIHVRELPDGVTRSAIFMSHEKGVHVGIHGRTMIDAGWPLALRAAINKHFATVFSLPHEDWKPTTKKDKQSPRAWFLQNCQPWTIETNEGETNAAS